MRAEDMVEWRRIWRDLQAFAHKTGAPAGTDVVKWFLAYVDGHTDRLSRDRLRALLQPPAEPK